MRDRDQIQSGELISAFIRQLTRADLVVTVISDKYLRSPYCMQEIYRLWQRCQTDPAELARCVVPIVLPDVKIGHLRDRAPYLEHWRDEAQEHDRLYAKFRDQLSPETVQEIRLVREFSEHVDGILKFLGDVLMPRQLEAHLDHGFPAVLSALRRRIAGRP